MKSRSVAGFVLGLVPGLILGFIAFYLIIIFATAESLVGAATGNVQSFFTIMSWLFMCGALLSIIGSAFCFTRAKIGGVIMLVAVVLLSILPGYILINSRTNISISLIMIIIIPVVCVLIGAICALRAKRKEVQLSPAIHNTLVNNMPVAQKQFCKYCGTRIEGIYCTNCGAKQE